MQYFWNIQIYKYNIYIFSYSMTSRNDCRIRLSFCIRYIYIYIHIPTRKYIYLYKHICTYIYFSALDRREYARVDKLFLSFNGSKSTHLFLNVYYSSRLDYPSLSRAYKMCAEIRSNAHAFYAYIVCTHTNKLGRILLFTYTHLHPHTCDL